MDGRGAGGDGDGACLFIDLDDGVDAVGFDVARGLVDEGADVIGVEVQAGFQIDVIFVMLRAVVGDERGDGAAAAAILHGLVDGLVGVQRDLADLRRERQRTIREHNSQRVGRGVLVDSLLNGVDGGVALQPADVDARNIDIRVDGVLPFQDHAVGTDAEHGQQDDAAKNDADFFAAAGLFRGGRAAGMLLRSGRLVGRLLRLKFSSFQMRSLLFGTRQFCRKSSIMVTHIIAEYPCFCNGDSFKKVCWNSEFSIKDCQIPYCSNARPHNCRPVFGLLSGHLLLWRA